MKIYTSYFAKAEKLRNAGIMPIGIALGIPRFFKGTSIQIVAPRRYMLDDKWTEEEYVKMYHNDVLGKVNPTLFIKELERISGGKDVALCCYEKPTDFCHRHILAKWITRKTGIEVLEFDYKPTAEIKPKAEQNLLF